MLAYVMLLLSTLTVGILQCKPFQSARYRYLIGRSIEINRIGLHCKNAHSVSGSLILLRVAAIAYIEKILCSPFLTAKVLNACLYIEGPFYLCHCQLSHASVQGLLGQSDNPTYAIIFPPAGFSPVHLLYDFSRVNPFGPAELCRNTKRKS